jgi:hypothetical protein
MVLASDFDKSKYLCAEDLKSEKKFRIKSVTVEVVGTGKEKEKEKKLVVWFTNDERGLVLNKTNNRTLRDKFGDDVSGWPGNIIIVFPTMVEMQGKMTPALRVRIPPPKGGNGQAVAAPPQPSPPTPSAQQQLDEFGQAQSPEKPSLSDDLDDEIGF